MRPEGKLVQGNEPEGEAEARACVQPLRAFLRRDGARTDGARAS